jgi:hypothetical protein
VAIASKLPWWLALSLAAVSYFALHAYATQPTAIAMVPGQVANAMLPMFFKGLASVGQYILPLLLAVAALVSLIKQNKATAKYINPPRTKAQVAQPAAMQAPSCPLCAGSMVLRSAKKGSNAGKSFWGCTNYPTCKGTHPAV